MKLKKDFYKKISLSFLCCILLFSMAVFFSASQIVSKTSALISSDIDEIPEAYVGIVLGSKVYENGALSPITKERADAAVKLYEVNKVSRILVSGDHGRDNYDEVNAIKEYLEVKNIPAENIFLDHAGFDTYDSMYRARDIFLVKDAIIVTQNFHQPRAVYIAQALGIDAFGYVADIHEEKVYTRNKMREQLARVKAVLDIWFHAKPRFLGEEIPITGDASLSWD